MQQRGLTPSRVFAAPPEPRPSRGKSKHSENPPEERRIADIVAETRTQDRCVCVGMTVDLSCIFCFLAVYFWKGESEKG